MKNCREQHRGQGHAMSAGLDACVAHSASAHRDRLACTRRIQPPRLYNDLRCSRARTFEVARCSLNTRSLLTCSTERQSLRTWPLVDLDAATELAAVAYPSRRAVLLSARLFDPSAGHLLARCPPAARSLAPAPCRGRPHWPLPIRAATLLTFGEVRRVGRAIRTPHGDQVRAMARSLLLWLLYYH